MTIHEALRLSIDLPRLDREVLLSHTLGQDRVFLMAHAETKLTPHQLRRYQDFLARATKHEPIAYIVGEREFYGRDFSVGPGVLIPRPETELIVEVTISRMKNTELRIKDQKRRNNFQQRSPANIQHSPRVAVIDVGTGSGAIIISLAKEFSSRSGLQTSRFSFFATDISPKALTYARKNARRHQVNKQIRFSACDLLRTIEKKLSAFDEVFIIANLPYLSPALYRSVAPNVRRYEPKEALVSGRDGLAHYRRLLNTLNILHTHGLKVHFFLEISPEQTDLFPAFFADIAPGSPFSIYPDLAGKPRVIDGSL
ncbi:MAG: peptide chain release factor N(5)-glutamine methyltransferase [Candidatus Moraniibacteriota bacterium]